MLYAFDLDGTLISSYMDNPGKDYHTWSVLPGRVEMLRQLHSAGHTIAIISNQGGVAFGMVSEADWQQKIDAVASQFPIDAVFVCFADVRSRDPRYSDPAQVARRKPSGAMLKEAIEFFGANDVIYVGDRPEDEQAASDAGVPFVWSQEFFHE